MASTRSGSKVKTHADRTPEARENRLISMAMDLVEERMRNGTATAQEVTHFLKLGSGKNRVEVEKLELEKQLVEAKTANIRAQKDMLQMYSDAISAMKRYSGNMDDEDEEEDYEGYNQMLL